MAKNQTKEEQSKADETIASALSSTERYIERNNKWLVIGLVVVVVLISGYLAWRNFYQAPREQEAQRQIFPAQQLFEKDSFAIALNGDGNNLGFLQILEEYSGTKTANLAHYYAGICYRSLGDLDNAIEQLKGEVEAEIADAPLVEGVISAVAGNFRGITLKELKNIAEESRSFTKVKKI